MSPPRIIRLLLLFVLATFAAAAASPESPSAVVGDDVVHFLNRTIDWYHRVQALDATPANSQELLLRSNVREGARQAVALALQFARAEAAMLDATAATTAPTTTTRGRNRNLAQVAAAADERATQLQSQVDQLNREMEDSPATSRPALAARRDRLIAQLELARTQRDILRQYTSFVSAAASGDTIGLTQKINELERSVPEVQGDTAAAGGAAGAGNSSAPAAGTEVAAATAASNASAAAAAAASQKPAAAAAEESPGVLGILRELFALTGQMKEMSDLTGETDRLAKSVDDLRAPLRAQIIDAVRRADTIGATTQASDDPAVADQQRRQLETLTARFKQITAAAVPLGEQAAVLDSTRQTLATWRGTVTRQYTRLVRDLLLRLAFLGIVILVLVIGSTLWRRATFKYVQDARRRRQLMVVRRVVVAAVVGLMIIGSVVTEFGSLATFAGLITAGIAVALQTVILSGVAYFFFIGRFGVRVGDRVTISGITGDVIEVGIFRLYLMELGGKKPDLHPTGRIVVFSNAVLFQPSAFYKQLPGADYSWHELAFTLAPETDFKLAESRLMGAVRAVYEGYQDDLRNQHAAVTHALHMPMEEPKPEGRFRFVDAGLEFAVRYPVEIRRASEIDDQITRRLLEAVNAEPRLKLVPSATPKIQPAA